MFTSISLGWVSTTYTLKAYPVRPRPALPGPIMAPGTLCQSHCQAHLFPPAHKQARLSSLHTQGLAQSKG